MDQARWQRSKDLFASASALDEALRSEYLQLECADDIELQAEVASLLRAHQTSDAIIDRPAAAYAAGELFVDPPELWVGRRIGAYELTDLLGRGGMGEVYRAQRSDDNFQKTVAIKLVRAGYQNDFILTRFKAERQILADLDHPNIARLLDGGATAEGLPYLAMELVDGEPIDQFCAKRALPMNERLQLFLKVCAAVSYAHQRLIVHRDIKPSNILVTADGSVKLLDFGIAKLVQPTRPSDSSVTALIALTPAFASPEQILGGQITTATDVYSLGVVLFHMLVESSPYRTPLRSTQDAIREVCNTEPTPPSASARSGNLIPDRELDSIVLMALRKEPERRYSSVERLAADISNHLAGLPVAALGGRRGYRLRKFLRRYRLQAGAIALFALLLIAGVALISRQSQHEALQRVRAETYAQSVRDLANLTLFKIDDAIRDLPGTTEARQLMVKNSLHYLDALASEAQDDISLQYELAAAYKKVGDVQGQPFQQNIGDPKGAAQSYAKAVQLLQGVVSKQPSNMLARARLIRTFTDESLLKLSAEGNAAAAASLSAQAVASLDEALRHFPQNADLARARWGVYNGHNINLYYSGHYTEARDATARMIAELETLHRADPSDRAVFEALAASYDNASTYLIADSEDPAVFARAEGYLGKASEYAHTLRDLAPNVSARILATSQAGLAHLKFMEGDLEGSVRLYRQILASGLEVDIKNYYSRVSADIVHTHFGNALVESKQFAEAEHVLDANLRELKSLLSVSDDPQPEFLLAVTQTALGKLKAAQASKNSTGQRLELWQDADKLFSDALSRFDRLQRGVVLPLADRRIVEQAKAGSQKAKEQLAAGSSAVSPAYARADHAV
jgi:tetratricopeptide (TPR) repeat protein